MKLILLSGGSGQRLWPLSNDARSKQFLKLLPSAEIGLDGEPVLESMVQRVFRQLKEVGLANDMFIATNKAQIDMIQSQLGNEIQTLIEPFRRDTFPAIALAVTALLDVHHVSENETIVVIPVDPYVESDFFSKLRELQPALDKTQAELALIGIEPTFPSEKYGYIVPEQTDASINGIPKVKQFTEKPTEEYAEQLLKMNAYWNGGVFSFRAGYIREKLKERALPSTYKEIYSNYHKMPKISFDYEIVEKADTVVFLPYVGEWKDLGTWNTLTDQMAVQQVGNVWGCLDSINTHIINELDIPIAVLEVPNIVVAASPDGILITDKNASPRVKELMKGHEHRPMFEERRWGFYRVLDFIKIDDQTEVLTKRIGVHAGKNLSYQKHFKRSEVWTIISGTGEFLHNEVVMTVGPGTVLQIACGDRHGIKALTNLQLIEVQTGSELVEEDVVRLCMNWEDALKYHHTEDFVINEAN